MKKVRKMWKKHTVAKKSEFLKHKIWKSDKIAKIKEGCTVFTEKNIAVKIIVELAKQYLGFE